MLDYYNLVGAGTTRLVHLDDVFLPLRYLDADFHFHDQVRLMRQLVARFDRLLVMRLVYSL